MGKDGKTAYGRLHGLETRELLCQFGETILWFVPKHLRDNADERFRYGIYLGRSIGSDQNFVWLFNGTVVRARAIVRLVPAARWDWTFAQRLTTTPLTENSSWLDSMGQQERPHQHLPLDQGDSPAGSFRRVKITLADLRTHGFTAGCLRCNCHRDANHRRARFHKHTEACRKRVYDCLLNAGSSKIKFAHSDRVQTQGQPAPPASGSEQPVVHDVEPSEPVEAHDPFHPFRRRPNQLPRRGQQ